MRRSQLRPLLFTKGLLRLGCAVHMWRFQSSSSEVPNPASESLSEAMKSKGFVTSTPNFSMENTEDVNVHDIVDDLVTDPVMGVDFVRDLYGPWLVLTDELQGELFIDHDQMVYLRPANGLGGGIGRIDLDTTETGVSFSMTLDAYVYPQTTEMPPPASITLHVTGLVKHVHAKSGDYETFSLVATWDKQDGTRGKFNAAKLSPWDPSTSAKPWEPKAELANIFEQVFKTPLELNSHLTRLASAKGGEDGKGTPLETCTSTSTSSSTPTASTGATSVHCKVLPSPTHLNLEPYRVGDVPDIFYIPNYITEAEEQQMLAIVKETPTELKSQLTKRTAQEWGCTMCEVCNKSFVSDKNIPPWIEKCHDMLLHDGIFTPSTFPNSVRVHEYNPGEGIAPHCEGPIYVPIVSILSLGSPCVMFFYPRREPYEQPMEHYNDTFRFDGEIAQQRPLQSVVMEPRSLMIFRGDAFYYYPHGTSDRTVDLLTPEVAGKVINRHLLQDPSLTEVTKGYRVSLTTRNLLSRCNHQPERAEYAMKRAWYVYHQMTPPSPLFTPAPTPVGAKPPRHAAPDSGVGIGTQIEAILTQQSAMQRQLGEMQQMLTADVAFRTEVSTVLGHLTTTLLEIDSKLEGLVEQSVGTPKGAPTPSSS